MYVHVQSCLNFCSPMDCSLPASSAHGIFQARILEWGAFHLSGDFPKSGIKPVSLESPALAGRFFFFLPLVPPGMPKGDAMAAWTVI